jgi:hypothetical protein
MKADDFRRSALAMQDAVEGAHMGHPDFRVNNRIFASLHSQDRFGMVRLTLDQQQRLIAEHPGSFAPESGAWGRSGGTRVMLTEIDEDTLGEAITLAWQNLANAAGKPARKRK